MVKAKPSKTTPEEAPPAGPAPEAPAGEKPPAEAPAAGPPPPPPAAGPPGGGPPPQNAAAGPPPPSATPSKQPMVMASAKASAARLYGNASVAFKKGSLWGKICMVIGAVEIIIGFLRVCVALWLLCGRREQSVTAQNIELFTPKEHAKEFPGPSGTGYDPYGSGRFPGGGGLAASVKTKKYKKEPDGGYMLTWETEVYDGLTLPKRHPSVYSSMTLQVILLLMLFVQIVASAALIFAAVKQHFLICVIWIIAALVNMNLYILTCAVVYISLFAMAFSILEIAEIVVVVFFIKEIGSNKASVGPAPMGPSQPMGPPQPSNRSMAQGGSRV